MESSDDKAARGLKQARARGIREFASERYDIGEIHFDFPASYRRVFLENDGAEVLRQINGLVIPS